MNLDEVEVNFQPIDFPQLEFLCFDVLLVVVSYDIFSCSDTPRDR